jgi:large subunit ribosomal protein L24
MKRRKPLPIKKGDRVRVMTGKHRGAEGKIKAVFPEDDRVIVENVNMIKKTLRPTQKNPRGGFQEREAPIHVSKVRILDPQSGEPTRIGYKRLESGRKVRVSVKSGASLDD